MCILLKYERIGSKDILNNEYICDTNKRNKISYLKNLDITLLKW